MLAIKKICQDGQDRYQLMRISQKITMEIAIFACKAYAIRKAKAIMAESKEAILLEYQDYFGQYILVGDDLVLSETPQPPVHQAHKGHKKRNKIAYPLILLALLCVNNPSFATNFNQLAQQCSVGVHPNTLQAIARVESQFNPYVIGVVKGRLQRQPRNLAEAIATAKSLHAQGRNFSMGLMQVNRYNLAAYGLNYETVFDPCKNINAGSKILKACYDRAGGDWKKAFSCYYSGNFTTGFKADFKGQPPYVTKVVLAAMDNSPNQMIGFSSSLKAKYSASSKNHLTKTSYVNQSEFIPISQSDQQSNQQPIAVAAVAQKKEQQTPPPEWDVFAYNEYQEKKPEWNVFQ